MAVLEFVVAVLSLLLFAGAVVDDDEGAAFGLSLVSVDAGFFEDKESQR